MDDASQLVRQLSAASLQELSGRGAAAGKRARRDSESAAARDAEAQTRRWPAQERGPRLGAEQRGAREALVLRRLRRIEPRAQPWNLSTMRAVLAFKRSAERARDAAPGAALAVPCADSSFAATSPTPRKRRRQSERSELAAGKHLLQQRLEHLGLRELVMEGDGNCLFRSAATELFGSQSLHEPVRAAVCEHMAAHAGDFAPLFESERDWQRYVSQMRRPRTWGDELALRALADCFRVTCHVLTSAGGLSSRGYYLVYEPSLSSSDSSGTRELAPLGTTAARNVFFTYLAPSHYNVLAASDDPLRRRLSAGGVRLLLQALQAP
jgi:hypothetical protein